MGFLIEYKWFFLIGTELLFWVCAVAFFLARYWFEMGRLGNLFLVLIVVEEVLANLFILGLGALDYQQAGEITGYQVVTVAFILYALTLGRHNAQRLDAYLKRKVARWKAGEASESASLSPETNRSTPYEKAKKYRREWYEHLALFVVGQTFLLIIGESWPAAFIIGDVPALPSGLMAASQVWAVAFTIDTIWSLSYTFWPGGQTQR